MASPFSSEPIAPAVASLLVAMLGAPGPGKAHLIARLRKDLLTLGIASQHLVEHPCSAETPQGGSDVPSIDERRRHAEALTRFMAAASRQAGVTLLGSSPLQWLHDDPDPTRAAYARHSQNLCAVTLLNTDTSVASTASDPALRRALEASGVTWQALVGPHERRAAQALAAILRAMDRRRRDASGAMSTGIWHHPCGRCGDAHCERQLFGSLTRPAAPATPAQDP